MAILIGCVTAATMLSAGEDETEIDDREPQVRKRPTPDRVHAKARHRAMAKPSISDNARDARKGICRKTAARTCCRGCHGESRLP
jgi:hypothetical protein